MIPRTDEENLSNLQREARAEQVRLLRAQRAMEGELATLVEDIYALTPEERRLLRETRPVRDPLDVLDGLIAGGAEGGRRGGGRGGGVSSPTRPSEGAVDRSENRRYPIDTRIEGSASSGMAQVACLWVNPRPDRTIY